MSAFHPLQTLAAGRIDGKRSAVDVPAALQREPFRARGVCVRAASGGRRNERADMNIIIILIVGAVVGWLAGLVMRTGGGIIFDIVVGIVGALLAGFLFGGSILNAPLSVTAILYSLLGAIILLALFKLVSRGRGRRY